MVCLTLNSFVKLMDYWSDGVFGDGVQLTSGVLRNNATEEGPVIAGKFREPDTHFMLAGFTLGLAAI